MFYHRAVKVAVAALLLFSCKKDPTPVVPPPVPVSGPKILLKDIDVTGQRPHFYHFEYNKDSTISLASFASGLGIYNVLYSGNKIAEMRDMTPANKDTLRYVYDNTGKLRMINIIDDKTNTIYGHIVFTFAGDTLKKLERDQMEEGSILFDKVEQFDYYPDGNLKTMVQVLRDISGESSDTTLYEQYDNKVNVADFDVVNGNINEHLFLFQGFHLQKNNPGKVTLTQPSGLNNNVTTYTYTYNPDNTPLQRVGDSFITGTGAGSGTHTPFTTTYTYY